MDDDQTDGRMSGQMDGRNDGRNDRRNDGLNDGWSAVMPLVELQDGRSARVLLDGKPVLLAREGERLFAIGARCTHQGAPLDRGPLRFGALDQVTCPVHGSVFSLRDGRVLRGPATMPEPAFEVRVVDGTVEIRAVGTDA